MATKTLALTLAELRSQARERRRPVRAQDAVAPLIRLLGACRGLHVDERASGLSLRFTGETELRQTFTLTVLLHSPDDRARLTTAETAVVELLCEGRTRAQIAKARGVSANTIKSQIRQVFRKLNVDSRVQLVRRWCP